MAIRIFNGFTCDARWPSKLRPDLSARWWKRIRVLRSSIQVRGLKIMPNLIG